MENRVVAGICFVIICGMVYWEYSYASIGSKSLIETYFRMDINSLFALSVATVGGCFGYVCSGWLSE